MDYNGVVDVVDTYHLGRVALAYGDFDELVELPDYVTYVSAISLNTTSIFVYKETILAICILRLCVFLSYYG